MEINRYNVTSPIEILSINLDMPKKYKQQCIQEAYRIGDKQNHKTNVKAIMSSYRIWEETDVFNLLLNNILKSIDYLDIYRPKDYSLNIDDAWTAIYKEGHHCIPHTHNPAYLSFVYYLKADKNLSPLIFNNCDIMVPAETGKLIVFPGNTLHSVSEHLGEDRICLAGNILVSH